jgi:hypothetical protein
MAKKKRPNYDARRAAAAARVRRPVPLRSKPLKFAPHVDFNRALERIYVHANIIDNAGRGDEALDAILAICAQHIDHKRLIQLEQEAENSLDAAP